MDLIPFYARLVATLAPCMDDLAPMLVDNLIRNLRGQVRKKDQIHIHSKIKNCRFIGETPREHVGGGELRRLLRLFALFTCNLCIGW